MKLKIEIDENLTEHEVIIRCSEMDDEILELQKQITDISRQNQSLIFYSGDTEYFIPLEQILFFETENSVIRAHTTHNMYTVRYRLYELEYLLPNNFMRISKSTILNTNHVYSITRNLTASSIVEFAGTHKQVYVSRYYYKPLKIKLDEKRNVYEK